jgi:hypothetical protein
VAATLVHSRILDLHSTMAADAVTELEAESGLDAVNAQ